jgi:fatty acid desaturase
MTEKSEMLPTDEVRALSQISPLRSTLSLVKTAALVVACLFAAVRWPHPLVVAAALVGIAGAQHGLAVLAHEAGHFRSYRTRWLNDLVGKICATPLGISMLTYRMIHNVHHHHLYEPVDPDLPLMAGYPRGRLYLIRKLLKDLAGITVIKNYAYFSGKPNGQRLPDTSATVRRAAARDRRIVLFANIAFVLLSIEFGFWRQYLLLWVLPAVTLLQAILRFRAILEHGAVADTSTPLRAARTNFVPRYLYWVLFPHDVHYHIEHHLYPSIPHYRLAECHRRLRARGILDGAEVATLAEVTRKVFGRFDQGPA